jgi:sulfur relay (sulfurtransferase) DsrF/TusC family protein
MPPTIVVVIREDPRKTHRAVEALRIALGLAAGDNPLTVVLLDQAPLLLVEESSDIVDKDILDKYLPSLKQLQVPFVVRSGTQLQFELDPEFSAREATRQEIDSLVSHSDRVLVF